MDIQPEKLKLIKWLASISDQSIIERLKLFRENFASGSDWLESISDDVRKSIDQGISDIENGRTLPHSEVLKNYRIID